MTKREAIETIDKRSEDIISLGKSIYMEPETGYREIKTSEKIGKIFREEGINYRDGIAITGLIGELDSGREGPTVAILSEMDALINYEHPDADPKTGAIHACGHFAQLSWMVGALFGLKEVIQSLSGKIVFMAIPAEEYIELEYRKKLIEGGKIQYFGGKQEFIRLGELDNVDIAIINHASSDTPPRSTWIVRGSNGFIGKRVRFIGKTAHAGAAPHKGINALNMFNVSLTAINAQRETFKDEDSVRVHMMVTHGGESVNVIPGEIDIEMYVRGKTIEAIEKTNSKVQRALKAGPMGIGGEVEIETFPGYLPLRANEKLNRVWETNAIQILGSKNIFFQESIGASTDMGDISHLIPSIHPSTGGFGGELHSRTFKIIDEEMAYIIPAKIYALTVIDLLKDEATLAMEIIKHHKPLLTKENYIKTLNSFVDREIWPKKN